MRRSPLPVRAAAFAVAVVFSAYGCSSATESSIPPDVRLEAMTPTSLTGAVAFLVTDVPVVRVTSQEGQPVAGVTVEFVLSAAGSVKQRFVISDRDGVASAGYWQLGTVAGVQRLTARIAGGPFVEFTALASPGPVTRLIALGGNLQSIALGDALKQPLRVRVTDAYNNDVPGAQVTFTVLTNPASSAQVTADPVAVAAWDDVIVSNDTPGHHQIRASAGGASAMFTITVCRTSCRNDELLFVHGVTLIRTNVAGETIGISEGYWWAQPAWSSTGRLAFVTIENYDYADLYITDRNGSNATIIGRYSAPSWSPDGTLLAVNSSDCFANCDIRIMKLQGDSVVQTTTLTKLGQSPVWSPDGGKIAFVVLDANTGASRIESMKLDGTERTFVTENLGGAISRPSWSPDGLRIAYSRCQNRCDVYVATADGLSSDLLVQGGNDPAWSPDGTWIAFTSFQPFESTYISYVAADGRTPPVALTQAGYWPVWRTMPPLNH